ncbi:unnamed protein product [Ixodes hexagonus]
MAAAAQNCTVVVADGAPPPDAADVDVRKTVVLGCSTAAIAVTALSVFVGLFLHPAILLLLVLGNGTCITIAYKYGYKTAVEEAPPAAASKTDAHGQSAPKGTGQKVQVPVIQIHPPNIVTEL